MNPMSTIVNPVKRTIIATIKPHVQLKITFIRIDKTAKCSSSSLSTSDVHITPHGVWPCCCSNGQLLRSHRLHTCVGMFTSARHRTLFVCRRSQLGRPAWRVFLCCDIVCNLVSN